MGLTTAAITLGGNKCTDARIAIPAWGASYADVAVDGEVTLSGAVTLTIADLAVQMTVLSGGPAAGRSFFRLVAGAGGWGKSLPRRSYSNDAGVKLATVLGDAATAVGETLDPTTIDQSARLGSYFVRPAGLAGQLLEQLSPNAWYVGEDGKTRLGARPTSTLTATATATTQVDLARGTVTLASETIAGILPGLVVDGLTAVDVEHEASLKGGLRSRIWGKQGGGASRRLAALRAIIDQLDPDRAFRGIYEYRIVTQAGERLNLQTVRVSTGMPDLERVVVRPGVPGCKATHTLGSRVLVGFVNADPGAPVVLAFEDAEGPGFDALTSIFIGPTAPVVSVGALPEPLAQSPALLTVLDAIATWMGALNTALAAPGATIGTIATAMSPATTTVDTAITTGHASIPTTVLKAT